MPGVKQGRSVQVKESRNGREEVASMSSSGSSRRSSSTSAELKKLTSGGIALLRKKSSVKAGTSGVEKMASRVVSLLRKTSSTNKAMGKRKIKPRKAFSFDDEPTPSPKKKPQKSVTGAKELYYNRGEYLALRNDEGGFWLCRGLMRVYDTTTKVKIQWLYEVKGRGQGDNLYGVDWHNVQYIDTDTILTNVKLQKMSTHTYKLAPQQREKAEKALQKALNAEKGIIDESDESEEEESEEESEEEEEPAPKKPRKTTKAKLKAKASAKGKRAKGQKAKASTSKKGKKQEEDASGKRKLTAAEKKNPNLLLKRNTKVEVVEKDPFLYSNESMAVLTSYGNTKLLFRAVYQNNIPLLQNLVDDLKTVHEVSPYHSVGRKQTPLAVALETGNVKAVQILAKEEFNRDPNKAERSSPVENLLQRVETGKYNYRSLGVPRIAQLTVSRGSREGNNALTKDMQHHRTENESFYSRLLMEKGAKKNMIDAFFRSAGVTDSYLEMSTEVIHAVRRGHRKTAGYAVEEAIKHGQTGFNFLMKEVLLFDKEDLRPKIGIPSVRTKCWVNMLMTPIHCAAINPNVKYLSRLLSIAPEYSVTDKQGRKPIHYAAACEGVAPLELLLKRGVDPEDADNQGITPLMIAAETGRVHNIEVLMKKGEQDQKKREEEDDDEDDEDEDEEGVPPQRSPGWGVAGINRTVSRTNKYYGMTALHIAIENEQLGALKCLIKHGADIHKTLGASKNKVTPLMMACYRGNLEMVKLLHKHNAVIEEKDRLKRTALIHAVMNGHAHIVSYLLNTGADPNAADSSGNTCMHYAVGYGWLYCMEMLVKAGAEYDTPNDWKMTPLGIAFLKGHMGLADKLLQKKNVDINFKDDKGMTLVALACASPLDAGIVEQVEYLVLQKKADCTIKDYNGFSPLHHLASNPVQRQSGRNWNVSVTDYPAVERSVKIARILVKSGCHADDTTVNKETPVMLAIQENNPSLVKYLVEQGGTITTDRNEHGENLLHLMAKQCLNTRLGPVLKLVHESLDVPAGTISPLEAMAKDVDHTGFTPLLRACQVYRDKKPGEEDADNGDNQDEESEYKSDANSMLDEDEKGDDDVDDEDENKDEDLDVGSEMDVDEEGEEDMDEEQDENDEENMEDEDAEADGEQKQEKNKRDPRGDAREFIEALLNLCKSNVNEQVGEKKPTKGQVHNTETDRYASGVGKFSVAHFMITNDVRDKDASSDTSEKNAGLAMILRYNPDLSLTDLQGRTPLVHALVYKDDKGKCHSEAALKLVECGADPDQKSQNVKEDKRATPLGLAARAGLTRLVKLMLAKGASVNACNSSGETPIHLMMMLDRAEHNVAELAEILVEAGADLTAVTTRWQQTPLHYAVNYNTSTADTTSELESILLDAGAPSQKKDKLGRMPLHYCFVKMAKPNDFSACDPIDVCSTLTGEENTIYSHINQVDNDGNTALHMAAYRGATICAMNLIQMGASVHVRDKRGNTPLSIAVGARHLSLTIMLIQQGADLDASCNLDMKFDEVLTADDEEKKKRVELLWKPLEDRQKDEPAVYPVFQVCVQNNWQGVVFLLLNNLKKAGLDYFSALEEYFITLDNCFICHIGPAEFVWYMTSRACMRHPIPDDLCCPSSKIPPIIYQAAVNTCSYNLMLTLMRKEHGNKWLCKTNREQQTLMHLLAQQTVSGGQEDLQLRVAGELLNRGVPLTDTDSYGCTPLHYACLANNVALGKFLLEKAANMDVNQGDSLGRTPFAMGFWRLGERKPSAAKEGNINFTLLQELLKCGAHINVLCDYPPPTAAQLGYTIKPIEGKMDGEVLIQDFHTVRKTGVPKTSPLICAVCYRDFNTAKLLLENGASPNYSDEKGRTPLMHAVRMNDVDMVKLLLDHSYIIPKKVVDDNLPIPFTEEKVKKGKKKSLGSPRGKAPRRKFTLGKSLKRQIADRGSDDEEDEDEEDEEEQKDVVEDKTPDDDVNVNYKPFPKKSSINPKLQDSRGWTVLHHLLQPLDCGTYDNVRLLVLLCESGADLNQRSSAGLRALDQALLMCAPNLIKAMQKLMGIPKEKWEKPLYTKDETKDGIVWTGSVPDYRADAAKLVQKLDLEAKKEADESNKSLAEPDSHLELDPGSAEVILDENQDIPYDTTLLKIDLKQGTWGMYNFYIMQVVYQKTKDLYILFNRWGRIGDDGQFQRTPYQKKEEAVKEFCKIFKAKTGNDWKKVKEFNHVPKKYRMVQLEEKQLNQVNLQDISFDLDSKLPSKLPRDVQNLMKQLTNVAWMKTAMMDRHVNVDSRHMPFGQIKREVLLKAREVLMQLVPLVKDMDKKMENPHDNAEACAELAGKVARMSNDYHQLVPTSDYAFEKARPVTDRETLTEEIKRIDNLLDLEVVSKVLAGAQYRVKDMNPLDYVYRSLGCHIQVADTRNQEVQLLLKYLQGTMYANGSNLTKRPYKIEAIYKLSRPGEAEKLGDLHLAHHRMLLHGTGNANLVGILAHGLLSAPPEAPRTGASFGQGVYFADKFVKSAGYAWNLEGVNEQFMLVSQVALGHYKQFYTLIDETWENVPKGYNSKQIVGEYVPHPQGDLTLSTGALIPSGDIWQQPLPDTIDRWERVRDSEYVIPDSKQICLRYLVQFRQK